MTDVTIKEKNMETDTKRGDQGTDHGDKSTGTPKTAS